MAIRLAQAVPVLLGVTLVSFILLHLSGDPTQLMLPLEAPPEQRAALRERLGLDEPLPLQYGVFVVNALRGDFGESLTYRRPALEVVLERMPATLQLGLTSMVVALAIAIPAGIIAAVRRGRTSEKVVLGIAVIGQSVPTHWLGMLMILIFSVELGWFPVSGRGSVAQMVLPVATLAMWSVALIARMTRSEMLEVLNSDFVRTARAMGLRERDVVLGHALRNALIPIVAIIVLQVGTLLGGALLTEIVFAWPGLGTLVMESVLRRDYPVVLAALTLVGTAFVLLNLLADVLYPFIDPRIRHGKE